MRIIYILFLLFAVTFISCKEKNNNDNEDKEGKEGKETIASKERLKNNKSVIFNPFLIKPRDFENSNEAGKYKDNLLVKKKESYYEFVKNPSTGKVIDTVIHIKISVPNENYRLKGVYNVFKRQTANIKAIAVHISDETTNPTCGVGTSKLLDLAIPIRYIEGHHLSRKKLTINKGDILRIGIINDYTPDFSQSRASILNQLEIDLLNNEPSNCRVFKKRKDKLPEGMLAIIRPRESGGGVIVEGP